MPFYTLDPQLYIYQIVGRIKDTEAMKDECVVGIKVSIVDECQVIRVVCQLLITI